MTGARMLAAVALLALACSADAAASPPPKTQPPLAAAFVSPAGDDGNACTRQAPCSSLDRAYRAVAPGGTVLVGAGSYPLQVIARDPAKAGSSADVTFAPAPGAHPAIEKVMLGDPNDGVPAPSHVALVDLSAGAFEAFDPASYLTWTDLDAGNFYLRGVQHVRIDGGDWGPCNAADPACDGNNKIDEPGVGPDADQPNDDITIDGATFHDYRVPTGSDYHFECLFVAAGTNITIESSRFYGCEFYDVFLQHFDSPITGLTIQDDWFDTPWNGQDVQDRNSAIGFSPRGIPFTDVLVRYNSFAPATGIAWNDDADSGDTTAYSDFRVVGNLIGTANYCDDSIAFAFNVIGDGFCGTTDRQGAVVYLGSGRQSPSYTPRPRPGSAGVDLVPGTDADQQIATDIDGTPRPIGAGWDAGAVERRGSGGDGN